MCIDHVGRDALSCGNAFPVSIECVTDRRLCLFERNIPNSPERLFERFSTFFTTTIDIADIVDFVLADFANQLLDFFAKNLVVRRPNGLVGGATDFCFLYEVAVVWTFALRHPVDSLLCITAGVAAEDHGLDVAMDNQMSACKQHDLEPEGTSFWLSD